MTTSRKMLSFVDTVREMPEKRGVERREDFNEIYMEFAEAKATEQASRCSQCGVPYCQDHCPLHNNIPDWLRLVAQERYEEAYALAQSTNTFPEICGRICPQDRLCEGHCVIEQAGHETVTIGAVEKYITDMAWREGWVRDFAPSFEKKQSVGIIGAGPGGLAAADQLRRLGYRVTVYDRHDRAGGLLTYGIPGFKLEKNAVMRRIQQAEASGIVFQLNTEIGKDISFQSVRDTHDAVLIATGVYKARHLSSPDPAGTVQALAYLTAANRREFGDVISKADSRGLDAKGKRVLVIGGGDTAMDCVRTAVRQGARSVKCIYRRDRANMPGSQREVLNAEEEGITFLWLSAPAGFEGDPIKSVNVQNMRLGAPDVTGRRMPEPIEGDVYKEPADMVIQALGFEPEDLQQAWDIPALDVTNWGTVKANFQTHATNLPGVYACGDIQRGASLVVWAIRDGRKAAQAMIAYLESKRLDAA